MLNAKLLKSGLRKYAKDVLELDLVFGLEHLHKRDIANLGFFSLALAGEVGEFCNIVKKIWRDGESGELWAKLDEEAVDVLIYLVEILNLSGTDFDKVWEEKHRVLYKRFHDRMNGDVRPYILDDRSLVRRDLHGSGGSGT